MKTCCLSQFFKAFYFISRFIVNSGMAVILKHVYCRIDQRSKCIEYKEVWQELRSRDILQNN